jgi:hypothetical protein
VAMFLLLSLVQGGPLPNLSCPFSSCLLIWPEQLHGAKFLFLR